MFIYIDGIQVEASEGQTVLEATTSTTSFTVLTGDNNG